MAKQELIEYVRSRIEKGETKQKIMSELVAKGWDSEQIDNVLGTVSSRHPERTNENSGLFLRAISGIGLFLLVNYALLLFSSPFPITFTRDIGWPILLLIIPLLLLIPFAFLVFISFSLGKRMGGKGDIKDILFGFGLAESVRLISLASVPLSSLGDMGVLFSLFISYLSTFLVYLLYFLVLQKYMGMAWKGIMLTLILSLTVYGLIVLLLSIYLPIAVITIPYVNLKFGLM